MSEVVDYAHPSEVYPPGFRARRGLNWGCIGLLYASFYLCRYNFPIANEAISKDHRIAYHAWAREVGLSNASAEEVFNVVPPPLIYEWTNPRYTYSLVKGGPLYQRLGFLASYMARYGIIRQTVELDDAMDMSLIAEVLKGRKPP